MSEDEYRECEANTYYGGTSAMPDPVDWKATAACHISITNELRARSAELEAEVDRLRHEIAHPFDAAERDHLLDLNQRLDCELMQARDRAERAEAERDKWHDLSDAAIVDWEAAEVRARDESIRADRLAEVVERVKEWSKLTSHTKAADEIFSILARSALADSEER